MLHVSAIVKYGLSCLLLVTLSGVSFPVVFIGNRFLWGFRRPTVLSRVLPLLCIDEVALPSDLSLHKAGAFTARETQVSYKLLV